MTFDHDDGSDVEYGEHELESEVLQQDEANQVDLNNGENDDVSVDIETTKEYDIEDEPDAEADASSILIDTSATTQSSTPASINVEPSYTAANSMPFYWICSRMEKIWQLKLRSVTPDGRRKHVSDDEKLKCLLQPKELERFEKMRPPQSLFPLLRLLMSEKDSSRALNMKENLLAKAYADAFQFVKEHEDYRKLINFTDPMIVGTDRAGDFSCVLEGVLEGRIVDPSGSRLSVGDINGLLDELVSLPAKASAARRMTNHDWRSSADIQHNAPPARKRSKGPTLKDLRADWVRRLNPQHSLKGELSPLEHKWLVRIILGKLQFGLGWTRIFNWYNPNAVAIWSSHNSLKGVCRILCDADLGSMEKEISAGSNDEKLKSVYNPNRTLRRESYMPKTKNPIRFGIPFEPMFSERTSFHRALTDLSTRHRDFANSHKIEDVLAIQHPTFSVETKLDGERMLVHFSRNGVVKIHSRRGKWYSVLYSPVLGPALRRAIGKHNMDIILDGEILAWDNGRNETIPFGNNGTIARLREKWMRRMGLCDSRDFGMHSSEKEIKTIVSSNLSKAKGEFDNSAGEECWLVFYAFDIVYLDGPGADDFLKGVVSPCVTPWPTPGSLIDLDGMERKKLLYSIVEAQPHEVEIVETIIIRSNGQVALGSDYFSMVAAAPLQECGWSANILDSIECNLANFIPNRAEIDARRRCGRSQEEICESRARALEQIYKQTVEDQRMEGLLFKDLSAPYCLGVMSKSLRYWLKFKPDYFNGSAASDLDLVICGAYFATGLRSAGKPSTFLCACVDSEDKHLFLPVCKVSAGSMDEQTKATLFSQTGLKIVPGDHDTAIDYGSWFKSDSSDQHTPDFISSRSYQSGSKDDGWRYTKALYPDLWIRPEDSMIVTLNAGEIVTSDVFSAGLSLRFPRITKLRDGADGKMPHEIESDRKLWAIFQEVTESRANFEGAALFDNFTKGPDKKQACRFLTEQQYSAINSAKKYQRKRTRPGIPIPLVDKVDCYALHGKSFTVLDGWYGLVDDSIDEKEARLEGWIDIAKRVKSSLCVKTFIKRNGGTVKLSIDRHDISTYVVGGRQCDARVQNYVKAIEKATLRARELSGSTKKVMDTAALARHIGVIRWTSVYSFVHQWKKLNVEKYPEANTRISLYEPTAFDYLCRPCIIDNCQVLGSHSIDNNIVLERALKYVENHATKAAAVVCNTETKSWRDIMFTSFNEKELLMLSCANGRTSKDERDIWMCGIDVGLSSAVVYPDMFQNELSGKNCYEDISPATIGVLARHDSDDEILSVLPLVRVTSARITSSLDASVTHVLISSDVARNEPFVILNLFALDKEPFFADARYDEEVKVRKRLFQRLQKFGAELQACSTYSKKEIMLVSPVWIRSTMWEKYKTIY